MDQDHVLGTLHELTAMKRPDGGLVDLAGSKVKAREVLVGRKAGRLHVIGDRPDLTFGQFCLQQLRQHRDCSFKSRCPPRHGLSDQWRSHGSIDQIGHGLGHAIHFEAAQHDDDGAGGWIMTHDGLR
jgi:hypothetical protein